jgi:RNA polymerase sigma-70 factor (ECF subfamily)
MAPTDAEIEALYDRYAPVLHHRARSILGSDEAAADAVHETFARVIRNWSRFRGESSPLTWMYRITTNWCLNQLRNRHGRADKRARHHDELAGATVTWQRDDSEAALVRRMLAEVDEQTRRIVLHVYFDDMTREQAAVAVGISVPTLRKRLRAFFDRCRAALEAAPPVALPAVVAALLLLPLLRSLA